VVLSTGKSPGLPTVDDLPTGLPCC